MIAIVDDDAATGQSIERLLKSYGYESKSYTSAGAFLASGVVGDIKCLILDVWMPGLTGIELQDCLLKADVEIPVIYITGYINELIIENARRTGALEILEKPFDDEILIARVEMAIRLANNN